MSRSSYLPPASPSSCVVSTHQTVLTSAQSASVTATTWTDFNDGTTTLSITLTPTSSGNKFKISGNLSFARNASVMVRPLQDGVPINVGDTAGSRTSAFFKMRAAGLSNAVASHGFCFGILAGTISSTTFKIQIFQASTANIGFNRGTTDTDASTTFRAISNLKIIEYSA